MSQDYFRSSRTVPASSRYRIFRSLIRFWISISQGKRRVLGADELAESAPAVLVITHPAGYRDALFLIAATNRQVHCLVGSKFTAGWLRRFLAWGLGTIPYEKEGEGWRRAVQTACNVLGNLGSVAVFTESPASERQESTRFASTAAAIVLEAESRNANQLDVQVVPVHLFLPAGRMRSSEHLFHFDRRIPAQVYMLPGKGTEERRAALCVALEEACRKNVFRLQPQDVRDFLAGLEEVLIEDLREDFSARSNWKQRVEDFQLSGFVGEWVEQLNFLHPSRLVALRESQRAYREALRRSSLEQLEIETSGPWVQSSPKRVLGWLETFVGFPVALYALANHLLAGLVLRIGGLWKRQDQSHRTALWISRCAVVLAFYAAQVLVTDRILGRAVAGYYAVSLPLSGLYLWRYAWLLEHRSRLLLLHSLAPRRASRARERRREFVRELNAARDAYIEAMELVH